MQDKETKKIDDTEMVVEVQYGSTTFQVRSKCEGTFTLEHLIKRLIQNEVENSQPYLKN